MISFTYCCKFCRKPGFVHGDEAGLGLINPDKWLENIACDRCGRYMVAKRKMVDALFKCCRTLELVRRSNNKDRPEIEAAVMKNLEWLTKKMAGIVCYYYRVINIWEQDFARMIFDKPNKLTVIISAYISGVSAESRTIHEHTPSLQPEPARKAQAPDHAQHPTATQPTLGILPTGA